MANKDYIQAAEEQGVAMASEPVATMVHTTSRRVHGKNQGYDRIDDLDWDRFPSQGPFSKEEAIARIDKFEEELKNGQVNWVRVDNIHEELKKRHSWL